MDNTSKRKEAWKNQMFLSISHLETTVAIEAGKTMGGIDLEETIKSSDTLGAAFCFLLPSPQLTLTLEEVAQPLVTNCSLYVPG